MPSNRSAWRVSGGPERSRLLSSALHDAAIAIACRQASALSPSKLRRSPQVGVDFFESCHRAERGSYVRFAPRTLVRCRFGTTPCAAGKCSTNGLAQSQSMIEQCVGPTHIVCDGEQLGGWVSERQLAPHRSPTLMRSASSERQDAVDEQGGPIQSPMHDVGAALLTRPGELAKANPESIAQRVDNACCRASVMME
jgi:hypothetical protein